ncbi:MAG: hypothetical protein Q9169_007166, partial [Polycauliona sp. 2 TL-2023]
TYTFQKAITTNDMQGLGILASLPREVRDQIWDRCSVRHNLHILRISPQVYAEASRTFHKLGVFALLPRVIRNRIWNHCSEQHLVQVFQASHQIYTEASQTFYKDQVFKIHVSPKYQRNSWIVIESNRGTAWPLQSLSHAICSGWKSVPFEKLNRIRIDIEASDSTDPGQFICLRHKCSDLAVLLESAKQGLPDLEINLVDSASAKWNPDGIMRRTVSIDPKRHYPPLRRTFPSKTSSEDSSDDEYDPACDRPVWQRCSPNGKRRDKTWTLDPDDNELEPSIAEDDGFSIMHTFFRLRNARSASMTAPCERGIYPLVKWSKYLEGKKPFETLSGTDYQSQEDLGTQQDMDEFYMQLDLDLDLLPGPTANMMRLERFSTWYTDKFQGKSNYEEEYRRIIMGLENTDVDLGIRRVWSLFRRFACMRALNPNGLERGYTFFQLVPMLTDHASLFGKITHAADIIPKAIDLGLIGDGWDADAWLRAWPQGIPPFDSSECSAAFSEKCKSDVSEKYEADFERKLQRWTRYDKVKEMRSCITKGILPLDLWSTLSVFDRRTLRMRETTRLNTHDGLPIEFTAAPAVDFPNLVRGVPTTSSTEDKSKKRKTTDVAASKPSPTKRPKTKEDDEKISLGWLACTNSPTARSGRGPLQPGAVSPKPPGAPPEAQRAAPKTASKPTPKATSKAKANVIINEALKSPLHVYVFGEGSSGKLGLGAMRNAIDVKRPRLNAILINEVPKSPLHVYIFGEGSSGKLGLGAMRNAIDVKRLRLNVNLPADKVGVIYIVYSGIRKALLTCNGKVLT